MPRKTVDPIYIPFTITTPAGTTAAAPMSTNLAVERGILEEIRILIPPGHSGLTGIRFTMSGQQVLPWSNLPAWIIGNDLNEPFEIGVEIDTMLRAITYNTGQYPHSHYLRCKIRQGTDSNPFAPLPIIDPSQLSMS